MRFFSLERTGSNLTSPRKTSGLTEDGTKIDLLPKKVLVKFLKKLLMKTSSEAQKEDTA
jgi:hypothetical protein